MKEGITTSSASREQKIILSKICELLSLFLRSSLFSIEKNSFFCEICTSNRESRLSKFEPSIFSTLGGSTSFCIFFECAKDFLSIILSSEFSEIKTYFLILLMLKPYQHLFLFCFNLPRKMLLARE